ncbi:hypothetical protein P691DRAFT_824396 [Macrolepiota fuliginosa MF-IS2]|uniref:Uncharacterized protein n=1 Tax=Macrolepiota fuliginosa MF-IS2 TaxID=1400762 RepID=A0A9P5X985_9AGAR|nr:hypothetical protein P691DRAFT_824396 [Macrolepiota fuliginosa MF-IS2]
MASPAGPVVAFDVLVFFAILLLTLALVPPLFSRYIVRRKTWHSIMLSTLVFAIALVLWVGHQSSSLPPNGNLCLVQVAFIHATPPLASIAMASYTADIYISIRHMFKSDDWEDGPEPGNIVLLVLLPWVTFFLVFLEAILVVGLLPSAKAHPAEPLAFYCRTDNNVAIVVSVVIVLLSCVVAVVCQAATGWMLYKNWIKVQRVSVTSTIRKYIHAFIRTLAFTVVAILSVTLGFIASLTIHKTVIAYTILLPFLPITSALIFGTYKDIMSFYVIYK